MPPKPILFTPGPLMTSETVKKAMLIDYGSRDRRFMEAVRFVREQFIEIAGLDPKEWVCILQQGAGTMGVEAAISTIFPTSGGKFLLINSGKYSERQGQIVKKLGFSPVELRMGEGQEIDFDKLEQLLRSNPDITTVGFVHHETSTGMVYPVERIASTVRRFIPNVSIVMDAMSSFPAIPIDVSKACDVLITASNKCIHGVPGVSIIIARRSLIMKCKGCSRSSTLDLYAELASFDKSGQFVITPPVHVVMALQQAILEFKASGGLGGRQKSYAEKAAVVRKAAKDLGFTFFLAEGRESTADIAVCLNMPTDPRWDFKRFYTYLNDHGFVIYPGKASHAETFRIGIIGDTTVEQTKQLMVCCRDALRSMGIDRLAAGSKV